MYAPPFGPGGAPPQAGRARPGVTHLRRHVRARAFSVDRGWLGSQAFYEASAFNANIGVWNTAAVTTLSYVCAAFSARAARQCKRDALGRVFDVARAVVRGGDRRCVRASVRRRVGTRMRGCARV
jgi:hypothetical protein